MHKTTKIAGLISLMIIGIVLFISNSFAIEAQNTSDPADVQCTVEMRKFLDEKSKGFRDYLQQHFQNKSTNSSLLDLALKRFEVLQNEINNKFYTYYPQAGLALTSEMSDVFACSQQKDNEIQINRELLKKYFTQTSNIKTTSALMDELKAINAKLDKLSLSVSQMYGKLETFKNNINCIIEKCI